MLSDLASLLDHLPDGDQSRAPLREPLQDPNDAVGVRCRPAGLLGQRQRVAQGLFGVGEVGPVLLGELAQIGDDGVELGGVRAGTAWYWAWACGPTAAAPVKAPPLTWIPSLWYSGTFSPM